MKRNGHFLVKYHPSLTFLTDMGKLNSQFSEGARKINAVHGAK